MKNNRHGIVAALALMGLLAALPLAAGGKTESSQPAAEPAAAAPADKSQIDPWIVNIRKDYLKYQGDIPASFRGPNGQKVTWSSDSLVLSVAEVEKIRAGKHKVAVCWHVLSGDYIAAWRKGIIDTCEHLGIKIVAETDANYDPGKQKADVETVIPLKPDVIISVPIEPVTSAEAYRPAIEAGIKIALGSNQPQGYVHGKDYIGITTANTHSRGLVAADLIREKVGEQSRVALVTWGVDYWFTKYSDNLVRTTLQQKYPGIRIVADEQFINWEEAGAVAAAVIQKHPDLDGIYTTYVSSALPIASACVDAGRPDIRVITNNIDEPTLVNLIRGGNIAGTGEDMTYNIGVDCVLLAAYGILNKTGPEYSVVPVMKVTRQNIREAWNLTKRIPISATLDAELRSAGL
jgi:ribose transport system substrate-binding protein